MTPSFAIPYCPHRTFRGPMLFAMVLVCANLLAARAQAHQQPTTLVLLDVGSTHVAMELQMPSSELALAFGQAVAQDPDTLAARAGSALTAYLLAHVHPRTTDGRAWSVSVVDMHVERAVQTQSGPYQEITCRLLLTPPAGASTRTFVLNYDAILHQVVTHKALVSVRQDWEGGRTGDDAMPVGTIQVDTRTTRIRPLTIDLARGSWSAGLIGMVRLGMQHIAAGTDHLLFLVVPLRS